MLDNIRRKKDNFIYSFIILATAAVMAFYGIGRMQSQSSPEGAAAWVNGDVITRGEFRQELEYRMAQYQSLLGGQYDEKFLAALQIPQRTLEELIQYKLLAQQARKLNIIVPDTELAAHIRALPYYQKDGKFDAEGYSKLPNRGMEERQQREKLEVAKFQTYLADRVKLTPTALKEAYALRDTKVSLEYAKIDFATLGSAHTPTSKDVESYLQKTPEKELQAYYDAHKRDFSDKPQVSLKQIRIGIPYQATETQKNEALKKINAIAKDLTAENFSAVAKSKSDDEYAKKGGNVGWVTRGTLEAPLEAAIDRLEAGKVSAPIETSFGYFLLMTTDKKDAVVHPFAEVKKRIGTTMLSESLRSQFADEKKKDWDKKLAAGTSVESDLKNLKIEMKKTGPFSIGQGYIPNVGQADPIVDAVFELTMEHPFPKRLIPFQNNYYFVKLVSMESPKAADFSKSEEVLEKSVGTALQTELITDWVTKLQKTATVKTELSFEKQSRDTETETD